VLTAADRALLRPLAWTRIAFAVVVLIRTTPLMRLIDPMIGFDVHPLLGWPRGTGISTAAFGWTLPAVVVEILCVARTVFAAALLLGYRPLVAGLGCGITGYVVVMQDVFGFTFTQTLLFLGCAVLATTDCAAVLAIRPEPPRSPRTSQLLVMALIMSVYFWAGFGKLRHDWLDGRALALFYEEGKLRGPIADLLLGTAARRAIAGPLVAFTEVALPPLLWFRRTRWIGLAMALGLHVTIEPMAHPDVIGWAMLALLLSLVPLRPALAERVNPSY
jgi:hypothetical protein